MIDQDGSQLSTVNAQLKEVPAGYKQTEVGVIPEDWEVVLCRSNKTHQIKQGMMQELLTGKTRLIQRSEGVV